MEKNKDKRKQIPIYTGVIKYFPDAIAEIAKVSYAGNQQHHPDKPLHWDRAKSTDELDALMRHLLEAGKIDNDGMRHTAKVAWRALANLQKEENTAKPDVTDRASEEIERSFELRTRDRERKLINKIDSALKRIEDGSYGYCDETGEPISIKRLEARPVATLSLEAQEMHEKAEKKLN